MNLDFNVGDDVWVVDRAALITKWRVASKEGMLLYDATGSMFPYNVFLNDGGKIFAEYSEAQLFVKRRVEENLEKLKAEYNMIAERMSRMDDFLRTLDNVVTEEAAMYNAIRNEIFQKTLSPSVTALGKIKNLSPEDAKKILSRMECDGFLIRNPTNGRYALSEL